MAEINEKGVFFDKEYLFWRNFLLAEFSVPLPPKQKLEMIWKIGNHLENPNSFEIIRKIGNHLEKIRTVLKPSRKLEIIWKNTV